MKLRLSVILDAMQLLFLTNGFPYPLTSGRLRSYYLMQQLARRHRVTLLSLAGMDYRPEHKAAVRSFVERVEVFPTVMGARGPNWRRTLHRARGLAAGLTPPLARMQSAIRELLRQEPFDAIIFSLGVFPAIARMPTPLLVADVCDAVGLHIRDRIVHSGWKGTLLLRVKQRMRRRLEQRVFARADSLLFSTARDLAAGAGAAAGRASVIPNGVDTEFWRRNTDRLGHRTILFTGVMKYPPNLDAARLLAEQIFPCVRRVVPDAELLLAGRDPPDVLRQIAQRFGATVTGTVDDLRPYLERASVFAAPLRFGAGIQNKVLEAMSMDVPVITSGRVAAGLQTQNGDLPPLQQAEGVDEFAEAVISRLQTSDRRPDSAARAFVSSHFNWESCGRRLEETIERAICVNQQRKVGRACHFV